MIINRIYENQKSSVVVACFLPGGAKDLPAPLNINSKIFVFMIKKNLNCAIEHLALKQEWNVVHFWCACSVTVFSKHQYINNLL